MRILEKENTCHRQDLLRKRNWSVTQQRLEQGTATDNGFVKGIGTNVKRGLFSSMTKTREEKTQSDNKDLDFVGAQNFG